MKVVFKLISTSYCCKFHAFWFHCLNEEQLKHFNNVKNEFKDFFLPLFKRTTFELREESRTLFTAVQ